MTSPPKGPASYFPSIEKKYGRPISEWKDLIRSSELTKHTELVNWLKTEYGLGHGHANALVAHTLQEDSPSHDEPMTRLATHRCAGLPPVTER